MFPLSLPLLPSLFHHYVMLLLFSFLFMSSLPFSASFPSSNPDPQLPPFPPFHSALSPPLLVSASSDPFPAFYRPSPTLSLSCHRLAFPSPSPFSAFPHPSLISPFPLCPHLPPPIHASNLIAATAGWRCIDRVKPSWGKQRRLPHRLLVLTPSEYLSEGVGASHTRHAVSRGKSGSKFSFHCSLMKRKPRTARGFFIGIADFT